MRRFAVLLRPVFAALVLAFLGSSAAVVAAARQVVMTERIRLNFIKPSLVAEQLNRSMVPGGDAAAPDTPAQPLLPKGVQQVVPNDRTNTLTLRGTPEGIAETRNLIALLDVAPRSVLVKMRVVRVRFTKSGPGEAETLSSPTLAAVNNARTPVRLDGPGGSLTATITPRINGDDSVTLTVEMGVLAGKVNRWATQSVQITRRLPSGETKRLIGLTDSKNLGVQMRVRQGDILDDALPGDADLLRAAAPFTAVYLEVTPEVVKDAVSGKQRP